MGEHNYIVDCSQRPEMKNRKENITLLLEGVSVYITCWDLLFKVIRYLEIQQTAKG